MLMALIRGAETEMHDLDVNKLNDMRAYLIVSGVLFAMGIIISAVSTFFALRRYLRLSRYLHCHQRYLTKRFPLRAFTRLRSYDISAVRPAFCR